MANRFKVVQGGPYPHFVTVTIVRWLPVFMSGSYCKIITDSLEHLRKNRDLAIHGYVIMPTHAHALVTAGQDDLSAIVRDFKRFTARAIYGQMEQDSNKLFAWVFRDCKQAGTDAKIKVWQDEFHPEAVCSQGFCQQKLDYIHGNPVRKGLVVDPSRYYWSSASFYYSEEAGPLGVDVLEW